MQEDIYGQACHFLLHHTAAIENANNDIFSTDKETQIHKFYGGGQDLKISTKIFCAVLLRTAVPAILKKDPEDKRGMVIVIHTWS